MYKRLKDELGLTSIELAFIIVGISGISILTVWTVIMVHIMPKFDAMYRDLGVELPLPTRILAGGTDAFQTYWWIGLLIGIIGTVGLRQYLRLETDQSWFNRLRVKLSPKHLTVFIGLFVVLVGVTVGFSAVAIVLPIFKANQLLG
ncbi:hypothetical protein C6503_18890 [Candidatus Poribacteria bacterium]|nr:MAG: hypothetical protein C6503_18890 [Candidatus Poribacteria bacterium]